MAITPFEQANFNLLSFADAYNDIFDSTAKDVQIELKDSNGNVYTKTVANRGKFKQQLWDDVGGALGQFSRTFYVDATNGDDNNDGSSANPFKTIEKACNSVPTGGVGYISLKSDININHNIFLYHKSISFNFNSYSINFKTDGKSYVYGFFIGDFSSLKFTNGTINTPNKDSDTSNYHSYNHPAIIKIGIKGDNFYSLACSYDVTYNDSGDYYFFEASYAAVSFSFQGTVNFSGSRSWDDLSSGLIKDSNGVPRNVISNIVF